MLSSVLYVHPALNFLLIRRGFAESFIGPGLHFSVDVVGAILDRPLDPAYTSLLMSPRPCRIVHWTQLTLLQCTIQHSRANISREMPARALTLPGRRRHWLSTLKFCQRKVLLGCGNCFQTLSKMILLSGRFLVEKR